MTITSPASHSLRVAVASDQPIFLRGLAGLVLATPHAQLLGEAQNGPEAVQLCEKTAPDLAVLDLRSSPARRREIVRAIRQRQPGIKIVLLVEAQEEASESGEEADLYQISREIGEEEFKAILERLCGNSAPLAHLDRTRTVQEDPVVNYPVPSSQMIPYRDQELLTRELVMAGRIQADILPEEPPIIHGWDIAATLRPARETSGDFYDFIPLSQHKWGVVIADVTDKGMGAALLMALSSTLIRTYAARFPTLPAFTLSTVSERILADTRGGMFVTAFFGILETHTGRFIYANAGHPPGYLVSLRKGKETVERLVRTGMALGVSEQAGWKQKSIRLEEGDLLALYTDGITEAQNPGGEAYGEERLVEMILAHTAGTAEEIRDALLEDVQHFMGNSPRQDDIALLVIKRCA